MHEELAMSHRYLLLLLVACWPAQAEIYKCVAPNGELTFSQTPCPGDDSKVTVERTVSIDKIDEADCKLAHRFALTTAQEMKRGVASSTVFDQYGGLSTLSRGTVSLISYVYQYRTNDDVSAERVAALSVAKCKAKSFGDVSCEQLPVDYTNSWGGCETIEKDGGVDDLPPVNATPARQAARQTHFQVSPETLPRQQADVRQSQARDEQRRATCKERIRDRIDSINAQLRSGYSASQGVRLKNQRRKLEQQHREC
ncbi:MAG: DUF4124 domain-containing protein [Woeseiaceae bacterium]